MNLFCQSATKASPIIGKSQSDTSLFGVGSKVTQNEGFTKSTTHFYDNVRSYSMGWLAKLLKTKSDGLALSPKTTWSTDSSHFIYKHKESVYNNDPIWETKCSTSPVENVFFTRKLKLDKLTEYVPSRNEINKYQIEHASSNEPNKRKADNSDLDENRQTKRQREIVDDNNNLDDDDDELDAEVAMYMENAGPPTIRDNGPVDRSTLEPTPFYQTENQSPWLRTENPSRWFRCIKECSDKSRFEISKYQVEHTSSNKSNKRKADNSDLDENRQTKRQRELIDDNNNLDDDDDDELDAEVAMYMENAGPPTIRDNGPVDRSNLEPTPFYQTETQSPWLRTENPSPWLRCIEGCFHRFRSPLGITREPQKGAIRILDPWPCLYRNTKFGELRVVGDLDLEKAPKHWKRPSKT